MRETTLPIDIRDLLDGLTDPNEEIRLTAAADIGSDGRFGERHLVATDQRLFLFSPDGDGHLTHVEILLKELSSVKTESLVGGGALMAQMDGRTVELLRYSNSLSRRFATLARNLEQLAKTGGVAPEGEKDQSRCTTCGRLLPERGGICPACVRKGKILRRIVAYAKPYWVQAALAVLLSIGGSVLGLAPPYLMKVLVDDVLTAGGSPKRLELVVGLLVGISLINVVIAITRGWLSNWLGGKISSDLRAELYRSLQMLRLSFYDKKQVGALMSRVTQDSGALQGFLVQGLPYLGTNLLMLIGIIYVLFSMNARLALLVLLPTPALVGGGVFFWRRIRPRFRRIWEKWAKLNALLSNAMSGIKVVKAFAQEDREIGRFDERNLGLLRANLQAQWMTSAFFPLMGFLMGLGTFIVWWIGGKDVLSGDLTLGTLMAFLAYLGMFYTPLQFLSQLNQMFSGALVGATRIFEILDAPPEIYDAPDAVPLPEVQGEIVFHDVSFGYDSLKPVLHNIDLHVHPGEMIGLVGHSGAGKTTTINLICRFYDVDEGAITLDGIDLRRILLKDLRSQIGIVPQEPFLFHGTIAENIAYAKPKATREEIIEAARAANAHDFIMQFPEGYDTQVGERGMRLSGGERQRISIARAILHNPKILILDEATSLVDTETERQIQQALARLVQDRTTFAIAHRLSTLRNAHRLMVLENGRKVEIGTHDELMAKEGVYHRLVQMQTELSRIKAVDG